MSTKHLRSIGLAAALAGLATPSHSYLWSQSTRGTQLRHDARILDHQVRATVHQGWADVEEDLVLGTQPSADSWNPAPTDNLDSWEITGQFNLPEGSVVTGALLWNGGTVLKAKLKGASTASGEYEAVVDRNTAPVFRPTDPLLIEKVGDNYNMKLYPVDWNGSRKLRIRYLVPLQASDDGWKIPIGSAFAQEAAGHAQQYEIDIDNQGGEGLKLERDGMSMPLSRTIKVADYPLVQSSTWWNPAPAYHAPFSVILPQKGSIALATSHDSGEWKGGYVMFKGKLPDSLLANSSLRQEFLVVWKWNDPNSYVVDYGWGKDLSTYGYQLVEQASSLVASTAQLGRASKTVKVGLLADEGDGKAAKTFGLSRWGSDTFALMQDYLGSFDQQSVLDRFNASSGGTGSSSNAAKARKEGAKRLAADLKIAFSMYSSDSGVVRHIVFVTCGPASDIPDASVSLPDWPEGLTASAWNSYSWYGYSGAHWPGADLPTLVQSHEVPSERRIDSWLPFAIPNVRVTWNLEFNAGNLAYSIDAVTGLENGASNSTVEFNGHARSPWSQDLSWKLYDRQGNLLGTRQEPAGNWIQIPSDSSVARLWGGSRRHWSEIWHTRTVGNVFGFVDPAHSLLALPSDSLGSDLQAAYATRGVPFLLPSEIFGIQLGGGEGTIEPEDPPVSGTISKSTIAGFVVRTLRGGRGLSIRLPQGLDASSELVIRDLNGRILAHWNAEQLKSLRDIDWNAPIGAARGTLLVELRTGHLRSVQTASIL